MWSESRLQRIQTLLQRFERITTGHVAQELDVSRETVRRDFLELEAQGVLKRVHGGALLVQEEPPIDKRNTIRVSHKQALARAAAQRIDHPVSLFMDAGSTTTLLARELALMSNLTIITNSLDAAALFRDSQATARQNNQIILIGGQLSEHVAATTGPSAVEEIHRFQVDIALLSPVGVDARHGATSFHHGEAVIARAMSSCARQTWILADYSKIGVRSRESYCMPDRIGLLVSNTQARQREGYEALAAAVPEVLLA
ncbi:DeoR/GlpR transcriptional regulator [Allopusillimonas soli]|uniref:DeoR/GlpR transcriptional regulator n=1 Tax=Allopusillimonas soli TaxID=659016 RepID=A0A853F5X8_9BURK|nr:DeoR/GlpR family DNA-binding transcription regulator [Allopusillimonas soli]NYT35944.1 DeoR/GlpR transcriptional regulator [Allopusillimonas soli]TEA76295.1 DeoR/GlpR transcriptional regulator [Allopusillimonas soli]